jgi:hypothetical protein
MTWILAGFCVGVVGVVMARATTRPLSEIVVDALYRSAMRASARAVAADRALLTYRTEMAKIRSAHTPEYAEVRG